MDHTLLFASHGVRGFNVWASQSFWRRGTEIGYAGGDNQLIVPQKMHVWIVYGIMVCIDARFSEGEN